VGYNSAIGPMGYVGCAGSIKIGNNVLIGPKATLIAENHKFDDFDRPIKDQGVQQQGIIIEDNVWIGANVVVLDGVTIHANSIIGADSLVSKDIEAGKIFVNRRNCWTRDRPVKE
ncbi:acyltransferase, partial [Oenococcus oeni]